jgi:hypothetical protein
MQKKGFLLPHIHQRNLPKLNSASQRVSTCSRTLDEISCASRPGLNSALIQVAPVCESILRMKSLETEVPTCDST